MLKSEEFKYSPTLSNSVQNGSVLSTTSIIIYTFLSGLSTDSQVIVTVPFDFAVTKPVFKPTLAIESSSLVYCISFMFAFSGSTYTGKFVCSPFLNLI